MLQIAKSALLLFLFSFSLFSCKNDPKVQTADIQAPIDTIIDTPVPKDGAVTFEITEGLIHWTGKKAMGSSHKGTINIEGGTFLVNQNRVLEGSINIDMMSISVTDIKDNGERRDLESHLRDQDFFEADKFPKATFVIKEVFPSNNPAFNWLIQGDLTMKGKTNPVNIPLNMTIDGTKLQASSPTFVINRTQWGVNFHSGLMGTTKDKLIDDNILLSLTVQAKQQ